MNPTLIKGTIIVTCALIAYSIAVISEQRKKKISPLILAFLTGGILLDMTATIFMIIGTRHIRLTLHGLIGYSALAAMLAATIIIWRAFLRQQPALSKKAHLYARLAYAWWVVGYFAGAIMAMTGVGR